ncbi:MAG: hypothetical protein H6827_10670 [Planctomycetes bacterium]|nr:hypothetical protein [Planctomycetota bacterium]
MIRTVYHHVLSTNRVVTHYRFALTVDGALWGMQSIDDSLCNLDRSVPFKVEAMFGEYGEFADTIRRRETPISRHLWEAFSPRTRDSLERADRFERRFPSSFVEELNTVVEGAPLYTPERFEGITLSSRTQELLRVDSGKVNHSLLNRWLLCDAFPGLLPVNRLAGVDADIFRHMTTGTDGKDVFSLCYHMGGNDSSADQESLIPPTTLSKLMPSQASVTSGVKPNFDEVLQLVWFNYASASYLHATPGGERALFQRLLMAEPTEMDTTFRSEEPGLPSHVRVTARNQEGVFSTSGLTNYAGLAFPLEFKWERRGKKWGLLETIEGRLVQVTPSENMPSPLEFGRAVQVLDYRVKRGEVAYEADGFRPRELVRLIELKRELEQDFMRRLRQWKQ